MKTLLLVVLIALIGTGVYWYLSQSRTADRKDQIEKELSEGAEKTREMFRNGLEKFSLRSDDIKEELERTGNVVRRKAREIGAMVSDATADTRITAAIKAKLVADRELSALRISVATTDGIVTLSGSVESPEEIGKAMLLALETEGVREAISTIQVRRTNSSGQTEAGRAEDRETNALPGK